MALVPLMRTYFWSFIVALMVFLLGGVLSLYEGVRHILKPEPVISPGSALLCWQSLLCSRAHRFAPPIVNTDA